MLCAFRHVKGMSVVFIQVCQGRECSLHSCVFKGVSVVFIQVC